MNWLRVFWTVLRQTFTDCFKEVQSTVLVFADLLKAPWDCVVHGSGFYYQLFRSGPAGTFYGNVNLEKTSLSSTHIEDTHTHTHTPLHMFEQNYKSSVTHNSFQFILFIIDIFSPLQLAITLYSIREGQRIE